MTKPKKKAVYQRISKGRALQVGKTYWLVEPFNNPEIRKVICTVENIHLLSQYSALGLICPSKIDAEGVLDKLNKAAYAAKTTYELAISTHKRIKLIAKAKAMKQKDYLFKYFNHFSCVQNGIFVKANANLVQLELINKELDKHEGK